MLSILSFQTKFPQLGLYFIAWYGYFRKRRSISLFAILNLEVTLLKNETYESSDTL
jgi:hypothetical protein